MGLEPAGNRLTTHDSRRTTVIARPAMWPALALLLVYSLAYVQFALRLSAFPFDLDQGETFDAWSGWLLDAGRLPYTDNQRYPYYSHGYPPVWSYLVSIPMAWLGPGVGSARAVSAVSAVLAAVVLGGAVLRATGRMSTGV